MLPRANTVKFGQREGKDTVTKIVRGASKPGAILTARLDAMQEVPIRSQEVVRVESLGNDRFLDQWEVEISDRKELEDLGR